MILISHIKLKLKPNPKYRNSKMLLLNTLPNIELTNNKKINSVWAIFNILCPNPT